MPNSGSQMAYTGPDVCRFALQGTGAVVLMARVVVTAPLAVVTVAGVKLHVASAGTPLVQANETVWVKSDDGVTVKV